MFSLGNVAQANETELIGSEHEQEQYEDEDAVMRPGEPLPAFFERLAAQAKEFLDDTVEGFYTDIKGLGNTLKSEFPIFDPITGIELEDWDEISVPGIGVVTVENYREKLKEVESKLQINGYSLDDVKDLQRLKELKDPEKLKEFMAEEAANQAIQHLDLDESIMAADLIEAVNNPEKLKERLLEKAKDQAMTELENLYTKANLGNLPIDEIQLPSSSPAVVADSRDDLLTLQSKEWSLEQGDKKSIAASALASLQVKGGTNELFAKAEARADAAIMGKEMNLAAGHIVATTGVLDQLGQYPPYASAHLEVLQTTLYSKKWTGDNLPSFGDGFSLDGVENEALYKLAIRKGAKYRFAIGPIPMSGEVGAIGEAGFKWAMGVGGNSAGASFIAYGRASGFANIAADIVILSAGAEAEVVIFNDDLALTGEGRLEMDVLGRPKSVVSFKGTNTLTALQGKMLFFVKGWAPVKEPPFLKEKTWDWDIFDWKGINTGEKVLFDFALHRDRDGYKADGAPSMEDMNDIEVDDKLTTAYQGGYSNMLSKKDDIPFQGDELNRRLQAQIDRVKDLVGEL